MNKKNLMGGGNTLTQYTEPEVRTIELNLEGLVCLSLIDALAVDSSFESLNDETTLTW